MTPSALLYCTLRCQHTHILKILWNFHLVLYFQNTLWHRYIHNRISFSHLSFCSNSLIWGGGCWDHWDQMGSIKFFLPSDSPTTIPTAFLLFKIRPKSRSNPSAWEVRCQGSNPIYIISSVILGRFVNFFISKMG